MNTGTRRMWSRRVLRAGWVLAPVLRFPAAVWKFFFGSKEAAWWTIGLSTVLFGMGSCTMRDINMDRVATGQALEAAMKDNPCMLNLMPRRQTLDKKGAPLTNRDLYIGQRDCTKFAETVGRLAEQTATMKKLGAIK